MAYLTGRDASELGHILQDAVIKCSERCLYQAAKWSSELLNSLPASDEPASPADTEVDSPMEASEYGFPKAPGILSQNDNLREARLEANEAHKYLMAKSFFDCREYDRCAAVFLPVALPRNLMSEPNSPRSKRLQKHAPTAKTAPAGPKATQDGPNAEAIPVLSQKALFLALYAKYLAGEKRREEECEMILGPADGPGTVNRELVEIIRILRARLETDSETDPGQGWLEYLYGVALSKSKNNDEAKKWLLRSITQYAWNWSAWQELGGLVGTVDELHDIAPSLPSNIMTFIFHTVQRQELFQCDEATIAQLKQIKRIFPTSPFLKTQKALLHYHAKDFEKAARTFSKIIAADPYRLEDLDTYSNILYVMERRAHLAFLAQLTTSIDKFRPETCCIVGNYYALKSEHEKAVLYFRRALTLDRSFLSAWTLMGHEYIELKNTQAAIECYRRAVDANSKDFRAWYGLGQTYEILEMQMYALWYYKRAAALSPLDPKMWSAVGSCLAKMHRPSDAIAAFKRALEAGAFYEGGPASSSSSMIQRPGAVLDPEVLYAIATMYDALGDRDETRAYLELVLAQEEGGAGAVDDAADDTPRQSFNRYDSVRQSLGRNDPLRQSFGRNDTARQSLSRNDPLGRSFAGTDPLGRSFSGNDPLGRSFSGNDPLHRSLSGNDPLRQSLSGNDPSRQSLSGNEPLRQSLSGNDPRRQSMNGSATGAGASSGSAAGGGGGVGVTATTSRARLWLTKLQMARGGREALDHAMKLANELCQDGWEVEEAKALIKEVRARLEIEQRD